MATLHRAAAGFAGEPGPISLWTGVLAAPAAFLLNLGVSYLLVTLGCETATPWLHLSSLVAFLLAAGGGSLAWRDWRRSGREWPGDGGSVLARSRFLAVLGLMTSALFTLLVLAQWLAVPFLGPCRQI